jgi:hypothetical protein
MCGITHLQTQNNQFAIYKKMKIELPNSWEGVTIEQFQALQKILQEKGDEYATNVAIISIMSGVPVDEIETYSLKTYAKCMRTLSFLSEQLLGQVQKVVEFGGLRYDVITDVYKLNGGQYITLMHLMKDPDKVIDQLNEIMAVFLVPKKKVWWGWKKQPYDSEKHKEVAEAMLQAPMTIVQPLSAFFLSSYLKSAKHILESSVRKAEKIKKQAERKLRRLKQNTDG